MEENSEVDETGPLTPNPKPDNTFHLTMQPTYWHKGFFNVPITSSPAFGGDGQPIEIFLGDGAEPILGTINRTANSNGTPRIFGGRELRTWVQAHVPEMSKVKIDVMSPTSIRLSLSADS